MTMIEIIVITTTATICIIKREPRFPLNPSSTINTMETSTINTMENLPYKGLTGRSF